MRKGTVPLIAALALYLLATSTDRKDRVDIESRLYVVSLAIDMKPQGPPDMLLDAEIANWRALGGAGMSGGGTPAKGKPSWQLRSSAATLVGGITKMQTESSRPLSLSHLEALVMGEETAKRDPAKVIFAIERHSEVQGRIQVTVAKGDASKIAEAQPPLDQIAAFVVPPLIDAMSSSSWLYHTTLEEAAEGLFLGRPFMLPQVSVGPDKAIRVDGLAVFTKGKLSGWLTNEEAAELSWVAGTVRGGLVEYSCVEKGHPDPVADDAFSITDARTKYRFIRQGSKLVVKVDVWAEGNIVEDEPGVTEGAHIKGDNIEIGKVIRKQMEQAIDIGIKRFHSDVFGVSTHLEKYHPWLWAEVKSGWDGKLGKDVIIEPGRIDINVRRVGMMR